MMSRCMWLVPACILFAWSAARPAGGALLHRGGYNPRGESSDTVGFSRQITINEGEAAADIACAFCKMVLHGDVKGDVAIFFGSVVVDPGSSIGGDVALLGGDVDLGEGAFVRGDAAILGGEIKEASGAGVRGDRVVLPGRLWILLPVLVPLLILAGIVALVVWLVRRARYGGPRMRRY